MSESKNQDWTGIIKPQAGLLNIDFKLLWQYRDLIGMFVRRDFVIFYKQTILGPLWFFIQPAIATLVMSFLFGKVANLSTDGTPMFLFYLSGIVCWQYFADCVTQSSQTFTTNANLFGKVYFPRLIVPLAIIISSLMKMGVQFLFFIIALSFHLFNGHSISPNSTIFLLPVLIITLAMLSLGIGLTISALTTKYKDLTLLIGFGVNLLMYTTPVILPISKMPSNYKLIVLINPVSSIIETFRYAFLGSGTYSLLSLAISFFVSLLILIVGIIIFNKVERSFIDTI